MKIVDPAHYDYLRRQYHRSPTRLSKECQACVTEEESDYYPSAQQKRADGELLPLA